MSNLEDWQPVETITPTLACEFLFASGTIRRGHTYGARTNILVYPGITPEELENDRSTHWRLSTTE